MTPLPGLGDRAAEVGGVTCRLSDVAAALECLRASLGMMVRQPLARAGSPLADCDYHAAARPWLDLGAPPGGRGAAGRPRTKEAFCTALADALERGRRAQMDEYCVPQVAAALDAFGRDHSYAAAMAQAAVALLHRRHTATLRRQLRQSAAIAVTACSAPPGCRLTTPCGTGQCVFASGVLKEITGPSARGRMRRPRGFSGAPGFSPDDALAELERLVPFRVAGAA